MPECHYEKEPLDLRLVMLRLWKQGWIIVGVTLLGTLLLGGGYYLKNVVLPPTQYAATSLYQVEYVSEVNSDTTQDKGVSYINHETWDRWMTTKEFLDIVYDNLEGTADADIDRETMKSYLSAELLTNHRMPDTIVTTDDPELSLRLAAAVEQSMVDFAGHQESIDNIRVVDPAVTVEIVNTSRPLNACVLSAVVSFVFIMAVLLFKEICSDSIWLPATLQLRFGLKSLGTVNSAGFGENVRYLFQNCRKAGVLAIDDMELSGVTEKLQQAEGDTDAQGGSASGDGRPSLEWIPLPGTELCPQVAETIRSLDGLVLVVRAGIGSSKKLEEVLAFLDTQDLKVDAALLWDADERLIRQYYWKETLFGGKR